MDIRKEQMPETRKERKYPPLHELNLLDDFLFDVTTTNLEACKIIVELAMGIRIREIRWKESQKVIHNLPGDRGVRMDFWVEDEDGQIFDVEMQKESEGNLPKRMRFYQALSDAPLLKSGEKGFDHMKSLYIVMICGFDPFGYGKYRYTFDNRCKEIPELAMGDGSMKIFLSTAGANEDEVERPLVDFLHYVEKSRREQVPEMCDERLRHLHEIVADIKSSEQVEVAYMKMQERDRLIEEQGEKRGEQRGIAIGEQRGEQRATDRINALTKKLLDENRTEDLNRATEDPEFQKKLLEEYGL